MALEIKFCFENELADLRWYVWWGDYPYASDVS
jgi:hypothetical protein